MIIKNMSNAKAPAGGEAGWGFDHLEELAAAGTSGIIIVPEDVQNLSVTLKVTGDGSTIVYTTTDRLNDVKSDVAGLVWVPWSLGAVHDDVKSTTFYPVTAIKMVQTGTGSSRLTIRAQ